MVPVDQRAHGARALGVVPADIELDAVGADASARWGPGPAPPMMTSLAESSPGISVRVRKSPRCSSSAMTVALRLAL